MIMNSVKVMDDEHHKWEHYFWTNEKKAIPQTVKWFQDHGFIVKELRELPREVYDEQIESIIEEFADQKFAAAADIARFAITSEHGGFYMDMDFAPLIWDNEFLYYFDSILWREGLCDDQIALNTYAFIVKPKHEAISIYLDLIRKTHHKDTRDHYIHNR